MHISVVIRCCNEERHIGRVLSGILAQTWPDVEIVVDSGSTETTVNNKRPLFSTCSIYWKTHQIGGKR